MQAVLLKLHDALEDAHRLIQEHNIKLNVLNEKEAVIKEREKEATSKLQMITEREAAVVPTENLRAEQAQLAKSIDKLNEDRESFKVLQDTFIKYRNEQTSILKAQREEMEEIMKHVEIGKKKIKEEIEKGIQEFISHFKK